MSDKNAEIKAAIDSLDVSRARELLRDALKEADGETYYLASRVSLDDEQRRTFLERAVEADTFHEQARKELNKLKGAAAPASPAAAASAPVSPAPAPASAPVISVDSNQLADTGQRLVAYIIDAVILGILGVIVGMVIRMPDIRLYSSFSAWSVAVNQWNTQIIIISLIITVVYFGFFLTQWNGQTPGKRAMKIRIVKANGTPLTIADALVRNVLGYTLSAIVILLGFVAVATDPNRQGWHDKIANTVVVKE